MIITWTRETTRRRSFVKVSISFGANHSRRLRSKSSRSNLTRLPPIAAKLRRFCTIDDSINLSRLQMDCSKTTRSVRTRKAWRIQFSGARRRHSCTVCTTKAMRATRWPHLGAAAISFSSSGRRWINNIDFDRNDFFFTLQSMTFIMQSWSFDKFFSTEDLGVICVLVNGGKVEVVEENWERDIYWWTWLLVCFQLFKSFYLNIAEHLSSIHIFVGHHWHQQMFVTLEMCNEAFSLIPEYFRAFWQNLSLGKLFQAYNETLI